MYDYPLLEVPTVLRVLSNGYEMETLESVELNLDDPMPQVEIVWRTLYTARRSPHWRKQRGLNKFIALDKANLSRYVVDLCTQLNEDGGVLSDLGNTIRFENAESDLRWTHGDPIVDNLMIRRHSNGDAEYVLTDPIPPTTATPSLQVVDYGRVIQSAAGYEQLRYGGRDYLDEAIWQDRVHTVLSWCVQSHESSWDGFDVDVIHGSLFYAIIHMYRGARTAPDAETRELLCSRARGLREMLKSWMR